MRLRTLLIVGSTISLIVSFILSAIFFTTLRQADATRERAIATVSAAKSVAELSSASLQFALDRSAANQERWQANRERADRSLAQSGSGGSASASIAAMRSRLQDLEAAAVRLATAPANEPAIVAALPDLLTPLAAMAADIAAVEQAAWNDLRRESRRLNSTAVFYALAAVLLAVAPFALFLNRVERPLAAVKRSIEAMERDEPPEPAVQQRSDEIGAIASAIVQLRAHLDLAKSQVAPTIAELQRSNARLAQFAYLASHDLQEPLRMVDSYVDLLSRRYKGRLDSDADEFIGFAQDGAKRMKTLVDNLLEYCRLGGVAPDMRPVPLDAVLDHVLHTLAQKVAAAEALIRRDPLPVVSGNEGELVQLLQNLLENALKFRSAAPLEIRVTAQRIAGSVRICVGDNGIGIAPEFHAKVFEIFKRLHGRAKYPGTGIGLANCQRIVENHGGRIWVESAPGVGSTFCFTLPQPGDHDA